MEKLATVQWSVHFHVSTFWDGMDAIRWKFWTKANYWYFHVSVDDNDTRVNPTIIVIGLMWLIKCYVACRIVESDLADLIQKQMFSVHDLIFVQKKGISCLTGSARAV